MSWEAIVWFDMVGWGEGLRRCNTVVDCVFAISEAVLFWKSRLYMFSGRLKTGVGYGFTFGHNISIE